MSLNDELRANGQVIASFQQTIQRCDLDAIPRMVKAVLESGAWRHRYDGYPPLEFKFNRLNDFITKPPVAGCGWPEDKVEALLEKAGDVDVLRMWREAITLSPGTNQFTMVHDNVMHHKKAKQGNSLTYTLVRLKKAKRDDLFQKVIAGELSANAAAIQVGFRKKPVKRCPKCGHEW